MAGRETGAALVTHPLMDEIAFTGSTVAGRIIDTTCGRLIRRCTLELGGKSAAIVCDDADLDVFLKCLPNASFMNNSQTYTTQSRILAPRARYGEVVDALTQFTRNLVVGDPLDPATTCGPMASETHLQRVMGYIDVGPHDHPVVPHGVRGVVGRAKGEPGSVETIIVPDPCPCEAVIKIQACGVCHTDRQSRPRRTRRQLAGLCREGPPGRQYGGFVRALGKWSPDGHQAPG